jgi:MFS transporter, FSR family, fosmidomycin resistance protein
MEPGSVLFFAAVTAAGALLNASLPIAIIAAQDLMPRSVAMASGMVLGLAHGAAGLVYIGVGALQETIGIGVALAASTVLLAPAAGLAFIVLTRAGNTAGAADSCGDLSECRCVVSVGHCIPALCGCQP